MKPVLTYTLVFLLKIYFRYVNLSIRFGFRIRKYKAERLTKPIAAEADAISHQIKNLQEELDSLEPRIKTAIATADRDLLPVLVNLNATLLTRTEALRDRAIAHQKSKYTSLQPIIAECEQWLLFLQARRIRHQAILGELSRWLKADRVAGPPRSLEFLLILFLPISDLQTIPGDLEEEYRTYWRPDLGPARAAIEYTRQVAEAFYRYTWRHLQRFAALAWRNLQRLANLAEIVDFIIKFIRMMF